MSDLKLVPLDPQTQKQVDNDFVFWKPLVTDEGGTLNLEAVKRELSDYSGLLHEVPQVYRHVTDGKIRNPNTKAHEVISEADDFTSKLFQKETAALEEALRLAQKETNDNTRN